MEQPSRTRMQLLLLKQQHQIARQGLGLLESKREALVREFFAIAESAYGVRDRLRESMQRASNALTLSLALAGRNALRSVSFTTGRELSVDLIEKNVWGVRFMELEYQPPVRALNARGYAISGTPPHVDETAGRFEAALELLLEAAAVEVKLKRLGQAIRNTTRRINALKERVLPFLEQQIRDVANSLQERELEDIFRIKRFKRRRVRPA